MNSFLARDVIYTSRATMSVSVCLSVTEVHWRIIGNLWFQITIPIYRVLRSRCMRARGKWSSPGRVEGSSRAMQPLLGALVNMSNFVCDIEHGHWLTGHCMIYDTAQYLYVKLIQSFHDVPAFVIPQIRLRRVYKLYLLTYNILYHNITMSCGEFNQSVQMCMCVPKFKQWKH